MWPSTYPYRNNIRKKVRPETFNSKKFIFVDRIFNLTVRATKCNHKLHLLLFYSLGCSNSQQVKFNDRSRIISPDKSLEHWIRGGNYNRLSKFRQVMVEIKALWKTVQQFPVILPEVRGKKMHKIQQN